MRRDQSLSPRTGKAGMGFGRAIFAKRDYSNFNHEEYYPLIA